MAGERTWNVATKVRESFTWRVLETVGPPITVIALILSLVQMWSSWHSTDTLEKAGQDVEQISKTVNNLQTTTDATLTKSQNVVNNLSATSDALERLVQTVPTRFVGEFPHNLAPITDLIKSTNKELRILVDVPGYGHFSNETGFVKYRSAIEELTRKKIAGTPNSKVQVTMLVYDRETIEASRAEQFAATYGYQVGEKNDVMSSSFMALTQNPRWGEFEGTYKNRFAAMKPTTWNAFFELLHGVNEDHIKRFKDNHVNVQEINGKRPMFIWLKDGREAIFSLVSFGTRREISFYTRDATLIDGLRSFFVAGG